jgi:hypothetical protein
VTSSKLHWPNQVQIARKESISVLSVSDLIQLCLGFTNIQRLICTKITFFLHSSEMPVYMKIIQL